MLYSVLGSQDFTRIDNHGTLVRWSQFAAVVVCWRHGQEKIGTGFCWGVANKGFFRATVALNLTPAEVQALGWSVSAISQNMGQLNGAQVHTAKNFLEVSLTPYPSNPTARLLSVSKLRQ